MSFLPNPLKRLFRKKPSKPTRAERERQELVRVISTEVDYESMSDSEKAQYGFSTSEKRNMYAARQMLRFLPSTGKEGGMLQAIATESGKTRQYVYQCFYPKEPAKIFGGRTAKHKLIWQSLVQKISTHQTLPKYQNLFETLISGKPVEVRISAPKYRFVMKRLQALNVAVTVEENASTIPTTYTLTPRVCISSHVQDA